MQQPCTQSLTEAKPSVLQKQSLVCRSSDWCSHNVFPVSASQKPYCDEHSRQVCGGSRVAGLFDSLQIQQVPGLLVQGEGPLLLYLQGVVRPQLDMLIFCCILAT